VVGLCSVSAGCLLAPVLLLLSSRACVLTRGAHRHECLGRNRADASQNNIIIKDEYDQIERDLAIFRQLSQPALKRRMNDATKLLHSYSVHISNGAAIANSTAKQEKGNIKRMEQMQELSQPIAKYIGDLSMTHSVHDSPRVLVSWETRELMHDLDANERSKSQIYLYQK
jgi:hypothetical protein